jgi:hypothetical protein
VVVPVTGQRGQHRERPQDRPFAPGRRLRLRGQQKIARKASSITPSGQYTYRPWAISGAALLLSAALAAVGVVSALDEVKLQVRGVTASAAVLNVEGDGEATWGDVSFETSGPQITADIRLPDDAEVGGRVRVLYDPLDPDRVRLDGVLGMMERVSHVLWFFFFAALPGWFAITFWREI